MELASNVVNRIVARIISINCSSIVSGIDS